MASKMGSIQKKGRRYKKRGVETKKGGRYKKGDDANFAPAFRGARPPTSRNENRLIRGQM